MTALVRTLSVMRRLLIAFVVAAGLLAGCGDDEPDPATPTADAPAAPAASAGGKVEIVMKGLLFEPKDVTVKAGTTVTWKNNEDIPHNVVAEEGAEFQSDTFGKDGTFDFEANRPGVVKYVCTIHPGMQGTLTVEE